MIATPPQKVKVGCLARCGNQGCYRRDFGVFRVRKAITCDKELKCGITVIPIWQQRWFQVLAAAVFLLVTTIVYFLARAAVVEINRPKIVAISAAQTAVVGDAWESYVEAKGGEPLSYQWYQGFRGDLSTPEAEATAARFENPSIVENSSYWVRVTNRFGSADSDAVTVKVIPAVDYGREMFELYREARATLEQTDSIQVLRRQLDSLTLTAEERLQDSNLLQITARKQAEAATAMHAKLKYLNSLDRRAVAQKLKEARGVTYPGIEGERRGKTISFIGEHWDALRDGHSLSPHELILSAEKLLPL